MKGLPTGAHEWDHPATLMGLHPSTAIDRVIFGTKFRAQKLKRGTFIQSNGFRMTLIDLSLVIKHKINLDDGGRVQF